MIAWLINWWDRLRESFWFVPAVLTLCAAVLACAAPWFDANFGESAYGGYSGIRTSGKEAQTTLSAIAGAAITVCGVVFSITMVSLSIASSQFGSRLIRMFLGDALTHLSLGSFVATALYCLLALVLVRQGQDTFSPTTTVGLSVLMVTADIIILIAFMHHTAVSIQAQSIVKEVATELTNCIERLYPVALDESDEINTSVDTPPPEGEHQSVRSGDEGYIQSIDEGAILLMCKEHDLVVDVLVKPGDFVVRGEILVHVFNAEDIDDFDSTIESFLQESFICGSRRTPRQDVLCPGNELVEIALRALSPGVNDSFTAITCIDWISAALTHLARREIPSPMLRDDDGKLRVTIGRVSLAEMSSTLLNPIRRAGSANVLVQHRLLEAVARVGWFVRRPEERVVLEHQVTMTVRECERTIADAADREPILNLATSVREQLRQRFGDGKTDCDKIPPKASGGC